MHPTSFAWRGSVAVLAVVGGCGPDRIAAPGTSTGVEYETAHFLIIDNASMSQAFIDSLEARLELERGRVAGLLPTLTPPDRITFRILDGIGIPFITTDDTSISQWSQTLALDYLPHQLTHHFTGYVRRPFFEEGLAVYVSELALPNATGVSPYRGQPPHAWVSYFEDHGSTISLFTARQADNFSYSLSGSSADASAWQVFIESGSFVRWVVETYGWDKWWQLYDIDDLGTALGAPTSTLETAWLTAAKNAFPTPLECEDALGTVGPRETFWCARARGQ